MTDLPDRILAAIEKTAKIARATVGGGMPWHAQAWSELRTAPSGEMGRNNHPDWTTDWVQIAVQGSGQSHGQTGYPDFRPDFRHMAHQNPQATLRRCEADKRTVERHAPHGTFYNDCGGCGEDWPCPDLLDRADAYGIEAS